MPNADDAREHLYQWRLLGFRARAYVQTSASLGMSVALIGWSFHCQPIIALDTSSEPGEIQYGIERILQEQKH